jgi:hypothetical protein
MLISQELLCNSFEPQLLCNSFAEKFILWKRFYDDFKDKQQEIYNTNLFDTTPKDPRLLKTSAIQPPHELQQINDKDKFFGHFILKNDHPTQATNNTKPNSPQTQPPQASNPQSQQTTHDLENIDDTIIMNEIAENIEILEDKPKPIPRKRKEETNEDTVTIGPGRPTKDTALLRDAKNEEESGNDDDSQYTLRDVHLLSGNGTIRKKNQLMTKHENDIKCFSIRHYASLEYLADKKKKAFAIIKLQRQKLKKLNYLEQNTLKDIKDINIM